MQDNDSLEARIKLDLIEAVESRIQSRFESDRTFIRETIGAAVKILTISLTVVAVILALFGIKTISDINDVIVETTENEIEKRLDKANPAVKYAKELETLYNEVLIYDLDLRIRTNTFVTRQITVSDDEVGRIVTALEQPEMRNETFQLGVTVLASTATLEQWERISNRFRAMVSAEDPYLWLMVSDDKRIALIHGLQKRADRQSIGTIRVIATNKNATASLRSAAIEFIGHIGDNEAVPILESLASGSDHTLKRVAILSLAKMRPSSAAVAKWIEGITPNSDARYLSNAFELIESLQLGISNVPVTTPIEERQAATALVRQIFERLASSGVALRFQPERINETFSTTLVVYRPGKYWSYFPIPTSSVFSFESSLALNELLRNAVLTSDEKKLKSLVAFLTIDWGKTGHVGAALHVTLSGKSKIETERGRNLTVETAPSGAILLAEANISMSPLRVNWVDAAGIVVSSMVAGIFGADEIEFSVKRADAFGFVFLPLK